MPPPAAAHPPATGTPTETPAPLPGIAWAAVLLPSAVLAGLELVRELGGPDAGLALPLLGVLWAITTLPLLALAWGMRRLVARPAGGAPPEVARALEAVARAEQVAMRSAEAVARLQALQAAGQAPGEPDRVPRPAARRLALLAAALSAAFVLAAVALAGVFAGPAPAPQEVHEHAALAVFALGERVALDDPRLDLSHRGVLRTHLHAADGYPGIVHLEGPPGATLGDVFRDALGAQLTEQGFRLDGPVHGGSAHQENATHRLRLLVQPAGQGWMEVKPVASYAPRDHDRLLVSFGDERGEALAAQLAAVPDRFPP